MKTSNMPLAILSFMILTIAHLSLAQNSPQDFVDAHNFIRSQVGIGPVTWNKTVADYALNYARIRSADCLLEHSQTPDYGENLAEGFDPFTGVDCVNFWATEKPHYDHGSNSCVGGECLHYTQIVWRNTQQIGCARVRCQSQEWFIICNYYPPGNIIGESPY